MKRPVSTQVRGRQTGVTLIEILVAVLLLSFALLGIAGLLSTTTRYQLGVEARSSVTYLFNDLTARIRANFDTATVSAAHYLYSDNWAAQQSATLTAPSPSCAASGGSNCSMNELAAFDLWEMRSAARRQMPQGALQISGDAAQGMVATYMWFDKDNTDTDAVGAATLKSAPTCVATMNAIEQQSCCPAAAAAPAGVRCLNLRFVP
ncbi:type IV pilus modification protein PilV [Acidovorax lacteus]|uniref:type IV pilus modification protein PilV n=1 Tax=Acidovorax lacteus TaxID=1924988 RepID=UPI0031EE35F7